MKTILPVFVFNLDTIQKDYISNFLFDDVFSMDVNQFENYMDLASSAPYLSPDAKIIYLTSAKEERRDALIDWLQTNGMGRYDLLTTDVNLNDEYSHRFIKKHIDQIFGDAKVFSFGFDSIYEYRSQISVINILIQKAA